MGWNAKYSHEETMRLVIDPTRGYYVISRSATATYHSTYHIVP